MEKEGVRFLVKIAVIGNGAWGRALALLASKRGHAVRIWGRRPNKDETSDLSIALKDAECVLFSVPSHAIREVCLSAAAHIHSDALLVSVAKGIEEGSGFRMSQV